MTKVVKLFGGDDLRIDSLLNEIKALVYNRGVGVFQLATVVGILRMVEHDLIEEAKHD